MQPEEPPVIRIIDLPGFARMEDLVRIYYQPNHPAPPIVDDTANRLSKETFGITQDDVHRSHHDIDEMATGELSEEALEFYSCIQDVGNSDDDALEVLKELGVDFSDERGHPLRLTRFFKFQALAAAVGLCGQLPDPEVSNAKRMEGSLADEARKFMESKKRS